MPLDPDPEEIMTPLTAGTFPEVASALETMLVRAPAVRTERSQGVDVSKNPAAVSYELRNVCFEVDLEAIESLDHWRSEIKPNLPWADDHFSERVCGHPLNPGAQWARWPWASSADKFRDEGKRFNHTYMERFWPKYARTTADGMLEDDPVPNERAVNSKFLERAGIGWSYGDLQDLVELLAEEPHTRQAYIPLFFPEDTGVGDGGRKPCTLGYQFLVRDDQLHIWYPIRSCDFVRHWRDDCYMAVRLLLWVLEGCRDISSQWSTIVPGTFSMHATSLHIFANDRIQMMKERELDRARA